MRTKVFHIFELVKKITEQKKQHKNPNKEKAIETLTLSGVYYLKNLYIIIS